jgi:hypothetical protein
LDLFFAESVRNNSPKEKKCVNEYAMLYKTSECKACARQSLEDTSLNKESEDSPNRQFQEEILASVQMKEESVNEREQSVRDLKDSSVSDDNVRRIINILIFPKRLKRSRDYEIDVRN